VQRSSSPGAGLYDFDSEAPFAKISADFSAFFLASGGFERMIYCELKIIR
jgi:hypothetical protein